jgi:hypothetical protein
MPADLDSTFQHLRNILRPHEPSLVTVHDEPGHYYLDTAHVLANRKPLFFGAVRTGSRHVSYHLMPLYLWPEMLEGVSAGLRRRMQGKSCFNFRQADPALFEELAALTRRGFECYREHHYVE